MTHKIIRPCGTETQIEMMAMIARNANPACNPITAVTPITDSGALEDDQLIWDVSVADCPRLGIWCSETSDVADLPPPLLRPSFAAHFPDSFRDHPDPDIAALAGCTVVLDRLDRLLGSPMTRTKEPKQVWKLVRHSPALFDAKDMLAAMTAALNDPACADERAAFCEALPVTAEQVTPAARAKAKG